MKRALMVSLALYLPLAGGAALALRFDFRPDSFGGPLFKALFLLWVMDGFACLVTSVGVIGRLVGGGHTRRAAAMLWPLSGLGFILGLPPSYILVELADKLARYLLYSSGN